MAKTRMTYLICYDDHRNFTEDIKKRFSDTSRYQVASFHNKQDLLTFCTKEAENNSCKVAVIGVPDAREQFESVDELTQEIRNSDPGTGLILLVPPDKMDDLKKSVRFNIDAYIPRNANSILRIQHYNLQEEEEYFGLRSSDIRCSGRNTLNCSTFQVPGIFLVTICQLILVARLLKVWWRIIHVQSLN
jgi:hypothetical protein